MKKELSGEDIHKYLIKDIGDMDIDVYETITSTNDKAKEMASNDNNIKNKVIVATSQTAGKGRLGRKFFSPDDTGIYMSIIVRPKLTAMESTMLTIAAAVAVVEAIKKVTGKETQIKWVNDIYINGKKICGILTEASMFAESIELKYAVVGIGINVFEPSCGFPEEISNIAASIYKKDEDIDIDVRNEIAAEILNKFFEYYMNIEDKSFIKKYKEYSFVIGKNITIISGNERKSAKVLDIDDECRLKVVYEDGKEESLSSGEISIRV